MGFRGIVPNSACTSVGAVLSWSPAYSGNGFRLVTADFGRGVLDVQEITSPNSHERNESFDDLSAGQRVLTASTHERGSRFQSVREAIASRSQKKADQSWL